MNGRPWTSDDWATLQRMHADGETWAAIDKALGRAPRTSRSKWENERAKDRTLTKIAARRIPTVPAEHHSLTAAFFGDPLPGRSALDRSRAGAVDPDYFDRRTAHLPKKPTLYTGQAR